MEHAEYCGIGANTQGKSQDGNCREAWGFAQCTQCVTSVLQNDFDERYSTHIAAFLAEAYLRAGESTAGLAAVDDGLQVAETTLDRTYWPELWRIKGELLLAGATAEQPRAAQRHRANLQSDEAERCLMRALELARQMEAKSLELRAATSLARAWQASGRGAEAYALLDPVCSWFGADATGPDLLDARQLLRELPASSPSGGNTARSVIPEDAPPSPPRAGRHRRR